ncbi:type II toxin-antitoxin system Phd/YefM family antitoxin [Methylobacterium sp. J-067]|uniref:type II toxin-antitoxin system Phd/YefM family antitoxin n=1 Tax=Methylobacterium sp. J-067 TaxID=2836648 RepID=UPI001FBA9DCF|nr:type II toxin-antitoxin system prevent-host-death family antitoxin [Methylobacterium sp. J-067]MCJ2026015.1 type II toxin-antitoxin system prevent-host-death family antitoxin [Methylobacterium sp. J-067]
MESVALDKADLDLADLIARAERGEHIVLTRDGAPVADLVPHPQAARRIDLAAGAAFLRSLGVDKPFAFIADDFDDPLPEDFLLRPSPGS